MHSDALFHYQHHLSYSLSLLLLSKEAISVPTTPDLPHPFISLLILKSNEKVVKGSTELLHGMGSSDTNSNYIVQSLLQLLLGFHELPNVSIYALILPAFHLYLYLDPSPPSHSLSSLTFDQPDGLPTEIESQAKLVGTTNSRGKLIPK